MIGHRLLRLGILRRSSGRTWMVGALVMALLLISAGHVATTAYADGDNGVGVSSQDAAVPTGPIAIGGPWYEFSFTTVGTFARGCAPADPGGPGCVSGAGSVFADAPPWTFTGPAKLEVTDAFLKGDAFDIFDGGAFVGGTPSVAPAGSCGADPAPCFADPATSSAAFNFGPGPHSITIRLRESVSPGAAYFRLVAGGTGPQCDLDLTYAGGQLTMKMTIATAQAAQLNLYVAALHFVIPIVTQIPLPANLPPTQIPVSFPLPPLGGVGGLVTMTTSSGGIICADWDLVNTGSPTSEGAGGLKELRNSIQSDGILSNR